MEPAVGRSSPAMSPSSVDFPLPDGPVTARPARPSSSRDSNGRPPYRVVNAGVSGDTSAGGAARLDWVLRNKPEIVIVALGANDGLRGQPISALRANLTAIVERLKARK